MTSALQVPTWPNTLDVTNFSNAYVVVFGFSIETATSTYTVHIKVYASQAAFVAGKNPIADLHYQNADGVFPDYNTAIADPNFVNPLVQIRDWIFNTVAVSESRFTGNTKLP